MKKSILSSYSRNLVITLFIVVSNYNLKAQWVERNNGLWGGVVNAIAVNETNLFAGTGNGGVFRSVNNGISWQSVNSGLTTTIINSLLINGSNLFAGTNAGIFLSTNNGDSWVAVNTGLTQTNIVSLTMIGTNLFAGTSRGVFLSTNNGTSWLSLTQGLGTSYISTLAASSNTIFAGTVGNGLFLSTDNGNHWNSSNTGLSATDIRSLFVSGNKIYLAADCGVYVSTNNGMNWQTINNRCDIRYYSLAVKDNSLFVGTDSGVYSTNDDGSDWTLVSSGLTSNTILSLAVDGNNILAGTYGAGVFLSLNNGISWTSANINLLVGKISDILVNGSNLFFATTGGGVYKSSNNGLNWNSINVGLSSTNINCLLFDGGVLYAGADGASGGLGGIFRTSDNGSVWNSISSGYDPNQPVFSLAANGENLFIGTGADGIFRSTNNGTSWFSVNNGLPENSSISSLGVDTGIIFAGTRSGVFVSNDNGANWLSKSSGLTNLNVSEVAFQGDKIFVGTFRSGGMFLSTDSGTTWAPISNGLNNKTIQSLVVNGTSVFAGTNAGLFRSVDNGASWVDISIGLPVSFITALEVNSDHIFAGTNGAGVWSRPLADFKKAQTITFNTLPSKTFGDSPFVLSTSASSNLPITYTSSDPTVAKISGNTVTILKAGIVTITASQPGDDSYNSAAEVQQTLTIGKATPNITWSNPTDIVYGTTLSSIQLNATSIVEGTFSYTPISGTKLNAGSNQNLSVTFTPTDATNYTSAAKQVTINVNKATPSITWSNPADIVYGTTLSATQLNASSSVTGIFTYAPAVNIKLNAGNAQQLSVTLSPTDDINYFTTTAKVSINVSKAQQQIIFGALPDKTIGDGTFTLTATANSTLPVSYSTTSDKVGIANGIVSLLKPGRVDITANQSGNENYNAAASISQSFCIKPLKPIITLSGLNTATPTLTSSASTGNQWYSGTTLLTGENSNVFVIKTSGTYKVQVTADDCLSEFSLDQNLIITGDIPTTSDPLLAYPNPATSILIIDLGNEGGKKEVAIFDLLGRNIFSQHTEGKKTEIDVSEYGRGLYIVKVQTTLRKSILRFEKQ